MGCLHALLKGSIYIYELFSYRDGREWSYETFVVCYEIEGRADTL